MKHFPLLIQMNINIDLSGYLYSQLNQNGIPVDQFMADVIAAVLVFVITLIIGWTVYYIFERIFMKWAKKTKTTLDDEILKNIKKPVFFFLLLIGFYIGVKQFSVLQAFSAELTIIFAIAEIFLIAFIITRVFNVLVAWVAERNTRKYGAEANNQLLFVLKKVINVFVYIFAFLFILYTNHIDLSGAVVGLGVTGIAIAFALQNILSDAFSAFSIYFDRPFEIGDFIVVGDYAGTVTKISMKSTRIQLLQGEELVYSNKELTSSSIRNFKKLEKRRIEFKIGVTYNTPVEKLKKIPVLVKKIINEQKDVQFDRTHFYEFGNFSLQFIIVYYIETSDYLKYMDTRQAINLDIKEAFEKEGIEMAFPTQTILMNQIKQQT
jgi:small-conductance mechanosensitive channel